MQRIIKFRAWDGNAMYDDIIPFPETSEILMTRSLTADMILYKVEAIMQFTGLHDKNGKEIYGGDFIRQYQRIRHKKTGNLDTRERLDQVCWGRYEDDEYEWSTMCWLLGTSPLPTEVPVYNNPYWECLEEKWEVIGNIYENPELLEIK